MAILALMTPRRAAWAQESLEFAIKAAYRHTLAPFVDWPPVDWPPAAFASRRLERAERAAGRRILYVPRSFRLLSLAISVRSGSTQGVGP